MNKIQGAFSFMELADRNIFPNHDKDYFQMQNAKKSFSWKQANHNADTQKVPQIIDYPILLTFGMIYAIMTLSI